MAKKQESDGSFRDLWNQLSKNRFGIVGFGLSLLQLVVHASWLLFQASLVGTKVVEQLDNSAWQLWVIRGLVVAGGLLTMIALFVCLYGAIHGKPKVLAITGLMLTFFTGLTTTFILLLQALS